MTPRLTAAMQVSALMRRVQGEGGNAVVLARGAAESGAILVVAAERGITTSILERILRADGRYGWEPVGPAGESERATWLERRRARDPDLWLIELDIADAQRFAAETSGDN